MDEYSVNISGEKLDIERVINALPSIVPKRVYRKGEMFSLQNGKRQENRRGIPNPIAIVSFDSSFDDLLGLLSYLHKNIELIVKAGNETLEIWALMFRGDQINGELSKKELKLLAEINAIFCWSVISDDQ